VCLVSLTIFFPSPTSQAPIQHTPSCGPSPNTPNSSQHLFRRRNMSKSTCLILAAALAALSGEADAHGNIIRASARSGTIGPMGQNALRLGIPRGASGIPGEVMSARCDHCVMENRPSNPSIGQWYTVNPAAHWDNANTYPSIPCMSNDGYGARGTINVQRGESMEFTFYVNADHGGFYRYELVNGTAPSNAQFMGSPISPWYSLHENAETNRNYPNRIVGYSKSDTNSYIYDMRRPPGAGLGSDRLQGNLVDRITLPQGAALGQSILRWNWFSLETGQVYTNCVDVVVGDGAPGSPTSAQPSPTPAPPPSPTAAPPGPCVTEFQQCGGSGYTGNRDCCAGMGCVASNEWWSGCFY
jgi:hypothetical protein